MFGVFDTQYGQQSGFVPRDPLSAVNPPRNPLSPGQTQVTPGSTTPTASDFLTRFKTGELLSKAGEKTKATVDAAGAALGALPVGRIGLLGGMIAPAMTAIEEAQAGRTTGAVGALGGGAVGALGGAAIGKVALGGLAAAPGLAGVIGKIGQAALPVIGGMIGAPTAAAAAESFRQKATGEPTKGKEDSFSTQLAMRGKITEQDLSMLNRELGVRTSNIKDLTQFYNQAQVDQFKAMAPELEKAKRNDFIRYQSAMALQGNIQGQLGVLATAGALAQGSQQGNYALTQTALQNNPYTQAIMPAPQIRFG
jgi:hypothetical protein